MVNDRQSLDLTPFARPRRRRRGRMADIGRPGALSRGRSGHGSPGGRYRGASRRPNWSGCWNTPRSTPPAPAARPPTCSIPAFPMFATGRGGQLTYHGPGQRVAYVMLDLKRRRPDVRAYVAGLEEWIIRTLAAFNVRGERREDRVGVWVSRPDKGEGFEDKIAAIGVRLQALGVVPRHLDQCGARPEPFRRHRALRRGRSALRRHQPGRSRPPREHGGRRCRAPAGVPARCSARSKSRLPEATI